MTSRAMFSGDLRFLSNFDTTVFPVPFWEGRLVQSNEHLFNACKTNVPAQRDWILEAPNPNTAKTRGNDRRLSLRPDWDTGGRVAAMQAGLAAKFAVPDLRARLIETGHLALVETNTWHDQFWGSCLCEKHAEVPGVNMLGELLMALRTTLTG